MSKSSYLKVKYQIPHEYHSFTKSKTKHLNRYLLFKLISNLLVEMYYSINCYKLLTRAIASKFNRNYKYVYILRIFIINFLNYLSNYSNKTKRYLLATNIFLRWNQYVGSSKNGVVSANPYILFVKFFTLLLQRRSAFAVIMRKEKTILYYIRQISNYIFYEKHIQILSAVKQNILSFELKKRIIDSIFNVGRYSRKSRFLNRRHIFNLVSFNIILSANRFDRIKRGRKNRTFYSNKLKFIQLYKNMYNIRTTGLFKKYIKYISSRLRRFVGISSIHFHQIYVFILSYFFYYLDLFNNTTELHNMSLRINGSKYSISSYYYFLIGDRIEIGSSVLNYLLALRRLSIAFVLSQMFYNCSLIPVVRLRHNRNKSKLLGNKFSIVYLNNYLNTNTSSIINESTNPYYNITMVARQALDYINARLKQYYHRSYNSSTRYRYMARVDKKKWKVYLSKKFMSRRNKYYLIGHVLDSATSNANSKIYMLATILGVYTYYLNSLELYKIHCSGSSSFIWFKNVLPLVATHLQFIAASNDCNMTAHPRVQLCTLNINRLLGNLNIGCLFNLNMRVDNSLYTQYFNFNKRLKYYTGFFNYENILLSLITSNRKQFRVRRLYSTSLLANVSDNTQIEENKLSKVVTPQRRHISTIYKLIRRASKLVSARIYRTVYYCLAKIIKLLSISKQRNVFIHETRKNYNINNMHLLFFPTIQGPYNYVKQDNLIRNTATLLYLRRCIGYNRKLTKLIFFRVKRKFKKKKKYIDKFEQSLKREYNFSIIQNNDYFRRLGVYDLYSFIKKVFIDKTMPAYNSEQYNSYFNQYKNKRMRYNSQRPMQYTNNYRNRNKFKYPPTSMHNRRQGSVFSRSYYTDSIAKMKAQVYTGKVDTASKASQIKGRVRVRLVNDTLRPHMYNNKLVMYQNNKMNQFSKGIGHLNISKRNKSKRNNFGSLIIAMLHRILNTCYMQSNRIRVKQPRWNNRTKNAHHKQLTRSIANDNVIDLYYLSGLDKQFKLVHSHDDLAHILTKIPSYKNSYNTIYLHIFINIYSYLKYLKQWLYTYSLNTVCHSMKNSIVPQFSIDLMYTLKTITNYHAVQRKFMCINTLLYKITSNKLKFIVYKHANIPHIRSSIILSMPNNIRYLFLSRSSKILASKFR